MADSGVSETDAAAFAAAPLSRELVSSNRRPRVVLVLSTYIPESFGGAEQQSRKLAQALARLSLQVSVLAPRLQSSTPVREQEGLITLQRFRLRSPPNLGGRHIISFLAWAAKLLWWLAWHRKEYDLIHVIHGRLHAIPAIVAGKLLAKPTLIKIGRGGREHFDLDVVNRKKLLGWWYARMLVNHATGYVANSREIAEDLRRWGVSTARIHRIPNGVDISGPLPRRATNITRFAYLGRLDPEKAIDLMIRGFARLRDRSRVTLAIVGDGRCRSALENLVAQLALQEIVSFKGTLSDVKPALLEADVFVSTSLSEGMSNALLEAMSFGLMPLVSRVSGVVEIVEDGRSGLLFSPGDLDAFAAKLQETLDLPADTRAAYAAAARARIADRFGIDQVAAQHLSLYRELVAGSPLAGF